MVVLICLQTISIQIHFVSLTISKNLVAGTVLSNKQMVLFVNATPG